MGFEVPRKQFRLVFEDADYAGAEVVCRSVSLGAFMEYLNVLGLDTVAEVESLLRRFGDEVLVSWNWEIDGKPLPADGTGFLAIPPEASRQIMSAWQLAVRGVSVPLADASRNGAPLPGAPIPMETL